MFHTPEPSAGIRAQRRRIMQMVGISDKDWFDEEEMLEKVTGKSRRSALAPFSQDERFAESRKSTKSTNVTDSCPRVLPLLSLSAVFCDRRTNRQTDKQKGSAIA